MLYIMWDKAKYFLFDLEKLHFVYHVTSFNWGNCMRYKSHYVHCKDCYVLCVSSVSVFGPLCVLHVCPVFCYNASSHCVQPWRWVIMLLWNCIHYFTLTVREMDSVCTWFRCYRFLVKLHSEHVSYPNGTRCVSMKWYYLSWSIIQITIYSAHSPLFSFHVLK